MIEFQNVTKRYRDNAVVNDVSLRFNEGAFSVLIGTSGSGKSTTLKMINRLVEHDSGQILLSDRPIKHYPLQDLRCRMGYAIQSIGLFPHWTVAQNIATVPTLLKWPMAKIRTRVDELLALLDLDPGQFRNRYPHALSGGQQQRVGVARALAADPEVLLMDEPFGALDPVTRATLQQEMRRIHKLSGRTIILVTHDIDEALQLADYLVLMDEGKVVQQGTPWQLLSHPQGVFVRDFFGRSELGIRMLSLRQVREYMRAGETITGEAVSQRLTLREALSYFIERGCERLPVVDDDGKPCGVLYFYDLLTHSVQEMNHASWS